jgi:tetratricopeptide (TPR) repeat protein
MPVSAQQRAHRLSAALKIMPDRLKSLRERVRELEDDARPASALLAVREILRHDPEDANALLLQGRLLASLARHGEAEESLLRALAVFADESAYAVYRELGHLYENWGRLELALAEFEKVVALRPEHASGHIYAGAVLAKMGRFDEAVASYMSATRCSGGRVDEAYLNLGLVLRAMERFAEAKASFERALALDPTYDEARAALSDVVTALQQDY